MRAVLRLTWAYFTATPLMRRLAALGLALTLIGMAGYVFMPARTLATGLRREAIWYELVVLALPWLGLILLLAATTLMPAMIERMGLGRSVWVLPGGRPRLFASAVLPAVALAVLTAGAATVAFLDYSLATSYGRIFFRTLLMAFGDFGLIYTAVWLVGKTSGVWRLAGTLWVVIAITIPLRYVGGIPDFTPLEALGLASWVVFGLILLAGGRIRYALRSLRARAKRRSGHLLPPVPYASGGEIDLLLGTTRPWIVALGQVVPIGVMAWFVTEREVWLVFLLVFSAISSAITSQAAARSRRLWLRFGWSRAQIHRRVEIAYGRYNAYSLGVLVMLFVGLARYAGFDLEVAVFGVALLVLGSIDCTCLGLLITRGLGWFESILCILTLIVLMLAALAIMRNDLSVALELELLLAALAVTYRFMARSRWIALDWTRCRPETAARGAG